MSAITIISIVVVCVALIAIIPTLVIKPRKNDFSKGERTQLKNEVFLPLVSELVNEGSKVSIPLNGDSMRPFLESKQDVGVLSKENQFKRGDVVLAEINTGHFVFHRIDSICIDGKKVKGPTGFEDADVVLRGDGNCGQVEHCKLKDIRAICHEVVRDGKKCDLQKSFKWKIYSAFWMNTLFARRYMLAAYRLLWLHQIPQRWTK